MQALLSSLGSIFLLFWLIVSQFTASAHADDIGRWDLRAKDDYCLISGPIAGDVMLSVHIDRSYEWGLGLTSNTWRLKLKTTVPLTAHVDGIAVASGKGAALSKGTVYIPLVGATAYKALQNGQTLVLVHPGGALTFPLAGSARGMTALLDCARALNGSGADQVAAVPPEELRAFLDAYMSASGNAKYRITSTSEGKLSFTLLDGTFGHVIAGRGNTKSADEYAGTVIAELATLCSGEFASSKKDLPTTDGTVIRRIEGVCRNANGETASIDAGISRLPDGTLIRIVFGKDIAGGSAEGRWQQVPSVPKAPGTTAGTRF